MSGHTPGDGVDAEQDLLAVRFERLHQLVHRTLRLGDCEAVAGHYDYLVRLLLEVRADVLRAYVVDLPVLVVLRLLAPGGGDAGEDDLAQRTPESAAHLAREDRTRRPDERTGD